MVVICLFSVFRVGWGCSRMQLSGREVGKGLRVEALTLPSHAALIADSSP